MSTTIIPCIGGPANGQWIQIRPKLPMQIRESRGGYYQLNCVIEMNVGPEGSPITQGQQLWFLAHNTVLEPMTLTINDVFAAYGFPLDPRYMPKEKPCPHSLSIMKPVAV